MAKQSPPRNAGIYARISSDPEGLRAGVDRQEKDCRALARKKGWKVSQVYTDNDLSAWNGKQRPQYRALLDDIESGAIDAVLVWHLDRLSRSPRELEEFVDVCQVAGLADVATVTGDIDIAESDGLFAARILTAVSRKSSDDSSRRIRRKMEDLATQGLPTGGGKRPYGYEQDRVTVRKDEAKVIKESAKRVLSGEGLIGVVTDLNNRGIPTVAGGTWGTRTLKRILTGPRWAGLSEYKGAVVGPATWPAIIEPETHERLKSLLLDPSRSNGGTTARKYLLVGLSYCGLCGKRLLSRSRGHGGQPCYQCINTSPYHGCGSLSVVGKPLDDLVRDAVFEVVEGPRLAKAIKAIAGEDSEQKDLLESIRDDEASLEQLAKDHYADKLISRPEFLEARKVIEGRIDRSKRLLARYTEASVLASLPHDPQALRQAWETRGLDWRRAVIKVVLERIVVGPPEKRGRNWFDPSRVTFEWKV